MTAILTTLWATAVAVVVAVVVGEWFFCEKMAWEMTLRPIV